MAETQPDLKQIPEAIPVPDELKIIWLVGLSLSAICLLLQIFIFIRVPSSRKLDLKILTQISTARVANVALEYAIVTSSLRGWTLIIGLALYTYSDCALVCWMFVFSKNLYDKVIQVFMTKKITFIWTSVLIWLLSLPVGISCPIFLYIFREYYNISYKVYAIIKFIILSVNLFFFGRIFYIAIQRKSDGNDKGILRTCIISFILVSISSVQVFFTDLVSIAENNSLALLLSAFNSYQVIAVTYIFGNLIRRFTAESFKKTISRTLGSSVST